MEVAPRGAVSVPLQEVVGWNPEEGSVASEPSAEIRVLIWAQQSRKAKYEPKSQPARTLSWSTSQFIAIHPLNKGLRG